MADTQKHIVINALHAKTGGGLIFLNHLLPLISKDKALKFTIIAHEKYAARLSVPKNIKLEVVDFEGGFFKTVLWEQFKLPSLVRVLGGEITFNMANFCPIMAPKPVVYVTNNPEVRHYTKHFSMKVYWLVLIWMTRLSLLVSPRSFSNGDYIKKVYASGIWCFLQKKMVKATTACDLVADKKIIKKKGQIVAIGDFYSQKNYDVLVKAFAEVVQKRPDAKLIIIGREVYKDVYEQVKYLIDLLKLEKSVELKGFVAHDAVKKILAESEVYVSPSDAETFSLTLLEAMMLGTASVVRDYPFQHEVAREGGAEYVALTTCSKSQVRLFAQGMLHVLDDNKHRKALIKNGFDISSEYSWQKTADTICQNLKEL
ncbi:MAG: glycosyltransferase involved in cell wall biosynthesis [Alphaproteobacteria bacterium]|jgi:glycosyltransferase involved in cell wall biosynthesis